MNRSIFDLLLAEALAAGMSRATQEAGSPPDNFFVLPEDPQAWRKLYNDCTKEGLVICVEVTKEAHPPSINTHSHFLELARKIPNIPFVEVKTRFGRTFDKVREDLGGVETAPTLVIAFFDDDKVRIKQVQGEEKIKLGIGLGIIEGTIKEFLEQREKNKLAEKMAEHFADVLMGDLQRKQRQEYEERLKKERADLESRVKEKEDQKRKEEEKQRKNDEDRQKKIDQLRSMDLQNAKIADIKARMDELKIRHVGAITREDLIQQIKQVVPSIPHTKPRSDHSDLLSNYVTSNRHTEDVWLHRKKTNHNDTVQQQPTADTGQEDELLETRMLYACTLHDMDILGKIASKEEGVVVRAKCTKPGIPNSDRVYAMKIIMNIHDTSTLTKIQTDFKNEYDILSSLPKHKNVIQLFAFFYDRPKAHHQFSGFQLQDGIALCLLMENLSQNMQEHIDNLNRAKGPTADSALHWLRDVVSGLLFLFKNHIIHRDMKLENLLITGNRVKISDFGTAMRLDQNMKLPFTFVVPRGGNEAHLAPEILNTRSGPGKELNYTKQPVWEAGVLAYELTGHKSPFQRGGVDQRAYNVSSLPPLNKTYSKSAVDQESLPIPLTGLVRSMLEFFPSDRPSLDEVNDKLSYVA